MGANWKILLFEDEDGNVPVRDYLITLERGEQGRFKTRLKILEEQGPKAGRPYSDFLEDNLFELRLENSPHNPRFLYCVVDRCLYVLHGFSKTGRKSNKVPESEKNIARIRRAELLTRLERETQAPLQEQEKPSKKKR